ncbi:hypothetical protein SARC_14024, partial [Sphaeroforma arctica JP610]
SVVSPETITEDLPLELRRYYGQLGYMGLKFQLDESSPHGFAWSDAFLETVVSQSAIAYEKASVLFNYGACQSALAGATARGEQHTLKAVCAYLQSAAGCFKTLGEQFGNAPTSDMARPILNVITSLMLAQAQELVLERSVLDGGKY